MFTRLWRASILLCSYILFSTQPVKAISCYTCVSEKSWSDCNSKLSKLECPYDFLDVCMKLLRIKRINGTDVTHYIRMCGESLHCNGKECKRHRVYCELHCCNQDLCNSASALYSSLSLVSIVYAMRLLL